MGDFPLLQPSGLVEWPDDAAMRAQWQATLGRGALVVRPTRALAALEVIDVIIDALGSTAITLRAEVVRIEPERTMLRLLDGPVPIPPPPPINPFASRRIPITTSLTPLPDEMPAPDFPPRQPAPAITPSPASTPTITSTTLELTSTPPAITSPPPAITSPTPALPSPTSLPPAPSSSFLPPSFLPPLSSGPSSREPSSSFLSPFVTAPSSSSSSSPPLPPLPPSAAPELPVLEQVLPLLEPRAPSVKLLAISAPVPSSTFSLSPPTPTELRASSVPSGTFDARAPSRRFVDPPDAIDDPFAATPPAPTVSSKPALPAMSLAPTPSLSLPPSLSSTPSVPPSSGRFGNASDTSHIDSSPLRAAVPPIFSGDTLRFGSSAELQAARRDFVGIGAVLAIADSAAPTGVVEVRLIAGSAFSQTRVKCTFAAAGPGTVVVQAQRKDDWRIPLAELEANATGAISIVPTSSANVTLSLPQQGTLTNPLTPRGIMMVPVHRAVTEADLRQPSVPLFLRWLRTTRGVFRVELTGENQTIISFVVVDGREVRSPVAFAALGKLLAGHTYTYTMAELARPPTLSVTGRTLHLIVDVLRSLLGPHELDEIAAAFPHSKDQRLVRAVGAVADALGFTGPLARLIKTKLQGDDTVRGVTKAAIGARAVWDVLVPLELFAGLTLAAGEPRRSTPNEAVSGVGGSTGPPVASEPFVDKDHFAVLGLHWSCSPSAPIDAHVKTRRDFMPGGSRRPIDDAIAARAIKRIDEAFATLGNTDKRQAYRKATFNMVWPHQATLLVQQAKLAIYRKDLSEARDLLAAAQDISPSPEAGVLLNTLNRTG